MNNMSYTVTLDIGYYTNVYTDIQTHIIYTIKGQDQYEQQIKSQHFTVSTISPLSMGF